MNSPLWPSSDCNEVTPLAVGLGSGVRDQWWGLGGWGEGPAGPQGEGRLLSTQGKVLGPPSSITWIIIFKQSCQKKNICNRILGVFPSDSTRAMIAMMKYGWPSTLDQPPIASMPDPILWRIWRPPFWGATDQVDPTSTTCTTWRPAWESWCLMRSTCTLRSLRLK